MNGSGFDNLFLNKENGSVIDISGKDLGIDYRTLRYLIPMKRLGFFPPFYMPYESLIPEYNSLNQGFDIVHHLFYEHTYFLSQFSSLSGKSKIVVTTHAPLSRLLMNNGVFFKRSLNNISKVVCISPSQLKFWYRYVGKNKVTLIPHGLTPVENIVNKEQFYTVCVGYNGRDYETLFKAMEVVRKKYPDFKCHVVRKFMDEDSPSNIHFHQGISDDKLNELYRNCLFVTIPLHFATANNTILEALSHQKPIITTDLPDTRYYLSNKGALYVNKNDHLDLSDKIISLIESSSNRSKLSSFSNILRERLSWDRISKKYLDLYNEIL